jgi:hypothetical protein
MTYEELISQHLNTLNKDEKVCWLVYMINIFDKLERPDFLDKDILCILNKKLAINS